MGFLHFPMVLLHVPMVLLHFPMVSSSYGFPTCSYGFPTFSYGFPMVFLWFSYGFSPFSDLHFFQRTWWPRRPKPQDLLIIDLSDMLALHGIPAPSASHEWGMGLVISIRQNLAGNFVKQTNRFVRRWSFFRCLPSGYVKIAMENHYFRWKNPL